LASIDIQSLEEGAIMKILGINASPNGERSNILRLVKEV